MKREEKNLLRLLSFSGGIIGSGIVVGLPIFCNLMLSEVGKISMDGSGRALALEGTKVLKYSAGATVAFWVGIALLGALIGLLAAQYKIARHESLGKAIDEEEANRGSNIAKVTGNG